VLLAGHQGPKKSNIQMSKYANVYNPKMHISYF